MKALLLPYYKTRKERLSYMLRLVRASSLILTIPLIMLALYGIYGRLDFRDITYGAIIAFLVSLIIVRPYFGDLSALTAYVENLAFNKKAKAPALSFLSNFTKLSEAVDHLHHSWEERVVQFESLLIESKILFDLLPDILITLDDNCRIIRTNSAAHSAFKRRMTQMKLGEVIANPLLLEAVKEVMQDKKGKNLEIFLSEPLNRHYIVRIEKFPIQSAGGISIIIIMHDITESKNTEKMLSDFVANASHEIRTPLASLIGFVELLQTTAKDDEAAREQFLKIMAEQGERMARLVSDLLSLSKIEMNANTPPSEEVLMEDIIRSAIEQNQWNIQERNIQIEVHSVVLLPVVIGDGNELTQLLTNLISNAIKYGHENSVVTITAGVCDAIPQELKNQERGVENMVFVAVKDQGHGIEKEHLPRLTERFYRVDNARSRKNKVGGTGLGLSIAKHILRRHKGELRIESTIGIGSTFTVYLPIAIEMQKAYSL